MAEPQQPLDDRAEPLCQPVPPRFDLVTDGLLPVGLCLMLGSLVWFLIDVHSALSGGPTGLLRWVFFFFMVAVVGIARIGMRQGGLNASPYALLLLATMALFGWLYSMGGGRFGAGFGGSNPVATLLANYLIIAFIWVGGNLIVRRTTIDPNDPTLADGDGLLSSDAWTARGEQAAAVRHRPSPGRSVMVASVGAVLVFGLGHRALAGPGHAVHRQHAFWCMVVYLAAALAVLAMSALSGVRIHARQRRASFSPTVTRLWLIGTVPLIAAILLLAQVAPRLEPEPGSWRPAQAAVVTETLTRWRESLVEGMRRSEGSTTTRRSADQAGSEAGGPAGSSPGQGSSDAAAGAPPGGAAGEEQASESWPSGDQGRGQGSGDGQGDGPDDDPDASAERGATTETQPAPDSPPPAQPPSDADPAPSQVAADNQPAEAQPSDGDNQPEPPEPAEPTAPEPAATPPPPQPEPTPMDLATAGRLALGTLLAIGALVLLVWLARAVWRRWSRPGAAPADTTGPARPTRNPFVDPFSPWSPLRRLSAADKVRHVYRAFLAYGELLGHPRPSDVTAHEYLLLMPPSMQSWRSEIEALTDMYAATEYTQQEIDAGCLIELQAIWARLMQAVREVRR